jgi:hypothetical protein
MRLFSKFTWSLASQCFVILLAMFMLDGGRTAIATAALCSIMDLALILDWCLTKVRCFRHVPKMDSLPTWLLVSMAICFFFVSAMVAPALF